MLESVSHRSGRAYSSIRQIGWLHWLRFQVQIAYQRRIGHHTPLMLKSKQAAYPMLCRPNTSDLGVFCQIFLEREYRCLDDITAAEMIVDCGANVGYSSAYFLSRFPRCDLVAVEPDPGNYKALCANLAPYGSRAKAYQAGLWSHPASLKLSEDFAGLGAEWMRRVTECSPNDKAAIPGLDIPFLIKDSLHERISILKIDVEGAEVVVFSNGPERWLDRVDNIVIELHDNPPFEQSSQVFFTAIAKEGFHVSRCGELTVCKRS